MKKNVKGCLAFLLILTMTGMLLVGCGKKEEPYDGSYIEYNDDESSEKTESSSQEESSEASTKEESSEESSEPAEAAVDLTKINPLTGEASATDISGLRPFVVMVNNIEIATPSRGIAAADIIMELMEEGGITRMMAFFMHPENANNIGSIRSARIYNVEVAKSFDAYLVHCGGSNEAMNEIAYLGMQDIDQYIGTCTSDTFYRDSTRTAGGTEHSLFAWGEALSKNPEALNYRLEHESTYDNSYGFKFSKNAVDQCTDGDANYIFVTYDMGKQTNFQYDASRGGYVAYEYEKEYKDDGQTEITFENVIVMFAETWLQSDGIHISMDLSSGDGYYATEGKYVAIHWYKDSWDDNFHFTLADGTPLTMGIGKTFICVNQDGQHGYGGYVEFQ